MGDLLKDAIKVLVTLCVHMGREEWSNLCGHDSLGTPTTTAQHKKISDADPAEVLLLSETVRVESSDDKLCQSYSALGRWGTQHSITMRACLTPMMQPPLALKRSARHSHPRPHVRQGTGGEIPQTSHRHWSRNTGRYQN